MKTETEVLQDVEAWRKFGITKSDLVVKAAQDMIGWPYAWGATGQRCTVANREARIKNSKIADGDIKLIKKHCQVLNGSASACSGCLYHPEEQFTDMHDCIGFVNRVLDFAEVEHYGAGCTTMWNHAANWAMKGKLAGMPETICLVFQQFPGDASRMQHIGIYVGEGFVIHCSVEVKIQKLGAYPWTHFAVPLGMNDIVPDTHKTIKRGSTGPDVIECQEDLIQLGYDLGPSGVDGKFGARTEKAVKDFQQSVGLNSDGIVGPRTWEALDAAVGPDPPENLYTVIIPHLTLEDAEKLQAIYPDAEKRIEGK